VKLLSTVTPLKHWQEVSANRLEVFLRHQHRLTHLADQIILPLFFTAGGSFLTKGSSEHLESCIKVLELFTGQKVKTEKDGKCLVVNVPKFKRENHD